MLDFVPTAQQNFDARQNYSAQLRKTRLQNLEDMQRIMASAAAAGQEITPEWLSSVEASLITPETMLMGISPREAISQQMIDAANRKSEMARMQMELEGIEKEKKTEEMLIGIIGGLADSGKDQGAITAELLKKYPSFGQAVAAKLPSLMERYQSQAAAGIMKDARLGYILDPKQLPQDLSRPYTQDATNAAIAVNRRKVMHEVAGDLAAQLTASPNPIDIDSLKERTRQYMGSTGYVYDEDFITQTAQRAMEMKQAKDFEYGRDFMRNNAQPLIQLDRDNMERYTQEVQQGEAKATALIAAAREKSYAPLASLAAGIKAKDKTAIQLSQTPGYQDALQAYSFSPEASADFTSRVMDTGNVATALQQTKARFEQSGGVMTHEEALQEAEIEADVVRGMMSPAQFYKKWSDKLAADTQREIAFIQTRPDIADRDTAINNAIAASKKFDQMLREKARTIKQHVMPERLGIFNELAGYAYGGMTPGGQHYGVPPAPATSAQDATPLDMIPPLSLDVPKIEPTAKEVAAAQFALRQLEDARSAARLGAEVAQQIGIPPNLVLAVMQRESSLGTNPAASAENGSRAIGPMQITPIAEKDVNQHYGLSLDRTIPEDNIKIGALFLRLLLERNNGNPSAAVAAYLGTGKQDANGTTPSGYAREVLRAKAALDIAMGR